MKNQQSNEQLGMDIEKVRPQSGRHTWMPEKGRKRTSKRLARKKKLACSAQSTMETETKRAKETLWWKQGSCNFSCIWQSSSNFQLFQYLLSGKRVGKFSAHQDPEYSSVLRATLRVNKREVGVSPVGLSWKRISKRVNDDPSTVRFETWT